MNHFKINCPECKATHEADVLETLFSSHQITHEVRCRSCLTNFVIWTTSQFCIRKHPQGSILERRFPLPTSHKDNRLEEHVPNEHA